MDFSDKEFSRSGIFPMLKPTLVSNGFQIEKSVVDREFEDKPVGYVVDKNGYRLYVGIKRYIHNPSSVNKFVFDRCAELGMDIGIYYQFKDRELTPWEDKQPRLYIFGINKLKGHVLTVENARKLPTGQMIFMTNFSMNLGILYKRG